jgi:hypothetical protein
MKPSLAETFAPIFEQDVPSTGICELEAFRVVGIDLFKVTPSFQTKFLPDFRQVKVLFPTTDLTPTLVHLAPALAVEYAVGDDRDKTNNVISDKRLNFFISF